MHQQEEQASERGREGAGSQGWFIKQDVPCANWSTIPLGNFGQTVQNTSEFPI